MTAGSTLRFGHIAPGNGPRLHFAEAGGGDDVILFLHGLSDSWFSYSLLLPELPPGLHGYAIDQRGHGDSERPAAGYAMEDFARDAVGFLDAMKVARATVVGHSMGSFVAQRLAIDHPDRVARLVLVGSSVTAVTEGVVALQESVHVLPDPVPTAFVREFQAGTIHRPLAAAFVDTVVAESLKLPLHVWRDAVTGMLTADTQGSLARIQAPTLIVWGDQDQVFPGRDGQERLRQAIPGSTLHVYDGTGHATHWEQPARFAADLQRFMQTTR
jgi:pimeloyl-ACP methyl ester carboxylesterase